eukprot:242434_1
MATSIRNMLGFITAFLPLVYLVNSQQQTNYYINKWSSNQLLQHPMRYSIAGLTSNTTEGEYAGAIEMLIPPTSSMTPTPTGMDPVTGPGSFTGLSSNWAAGNPGMYGTIACQAALMRKGCDWESIYSPNSMVVVNYAMYFSRFDPDAYPNYHQDITTTNFYKHSVQFPSGNEAINYSTIHLGNAYPKPVALYDECYTTDNTQYIYLIGGRTTELNAGGSSKAFVWFDLINYKWHTGPDLGQARASSACVYHNNTSTIYAFGGDGTTVIEKWKKGAGYWEPVRSQMNATTVSIYAFEAPNSNTIFIVGVDIDIIPYSNGRGICYTFFADKDELYFCVNSPLMTMYFGSVYSTEQMIFYSIAGWSLNTLALTNYVQSTALSTTAPIDFSSSNIARNVSSTAKIPIKFTVADAYKWRPPHGDTKIKFAKINLYSLELDINNIVLLRNVTTSDTWSVDYNCSLCDSTGINCMNCLDGITMNYTMPYHGNQVRNNIYPVDTICVPNTYALATGFEVTITGTFFVTFSLPTAISHTYPTITVRLAHYQFPPNTNYTFLLSTENPAVQFDAKVKISTNSSDVFSCRIINYGNVSTCDEGFDPIINSQVLKRYHNMFNVTVQSVLHNTPIDIYPVNTFTITSQPCEMTFNKSRRYIMPGQIIPISIVSYSNLSVSKWYLFNLASSVPNKYQVDTALNIHTARNSNVIESCTLGEVNVSQPTWCSFGIRANIHYDPTTNNTFALTINPINTAAKLVYITPFEGIPVQIIPCKPGYGAAEVTSAMCVACVFGSFKLKYGVRPCWTCDSLDGVTCEGSSHVKINYNFWLSALDDKDEPRSLLDMQDSDVLFSSFCPNGWCCSKANGCDYLHDNDSLCAKNRDINTPLCGGCVEGTYELFGTQNCGECDDTNYIFIALIMIFVVVPFVSYIAYFECAPYKIPIANDHAEMAVELIISLIFDIIIYYYQSLSIILTSNGMTMSSWFQSFIFSVFSLNAVHISGSRGLCIIGQLDAFGKLILNFLFPLMTVPVLMLLFVLRNYSLDELLCFQKCNQCTCDICCKCSCKCTCLENRKPHVYPCFVRLLLLYVGSSLGTLLQLLTIVRLGYSSDSEALYFYAPTQHVSSTVLVIAIVAMCLICGLFLYIFYVLYRKTKDERFDANENQYFSFVQSFNAQQWFWQFVILFRRIMIQTTMSLQHLSPQLVTLCLTAFMFLYFGVQIHFKPFKYTCANAIEIMNLALLGLVLFSINVDLDKRISDGLIFIAALLPVFSLIGVVIYEVMVACKKKRDDKNVPLLHESGRVSS